MWGGSVRRRAQPTGLSGTVRHNGRMERQEAAGIWGRHYAGVNKPFARIRFDFVVTNEVAGAPITIVAREHAEAA